MADDPRPRPKPKKKAPKKATPNPRVGGDIDDPRYRFLNYDPDPTVNPTPRQQARLDAQAALREQLNAEAKGSIGRRLTGMAAPDDVAAAYLDPRRLNLPSNDPRSLSNTVQRGLGVYGVKDPAAERQLLDQFGRKPNAIDAAARAAETLPVRPVRTLTPADYVVQPWQTGETLVGNPNVGLVKLRDWDPEKRTRAPGLRTSYPTSIGAQLSLTGRGSLAPEPAAPTPLARAANPGLGVGTGPALSRLMPIDDMTLARTYDAEGIIPARTAVPAVSAPTPIEAAPSLRASAPGLSLRSNPAISRIAPGFLTRDPIDRFSTGVSTPGLRLMEQQFRPTPPLEPPPSVAPVDLDEIDDMNLARTYDAEGIPRTPRTPRSARPGLQMGNYRFAGRARPALTVLPGGAAGGGGGGVPPILAAAGGSAPPDPPNTPIDLSKYALGELGEEATKRTMGSRLLGAAGGAAKGFGAASLAGMGASMAGGMLDTPYTEDETGLDRADVGQFLKGAGTAATFGGPVAGALIGAGVASGPVGWGLLGAAALGAGIYTAFQGKKTTEEKISEAAEAGGLDKAYYMDNYKFLKALDVPDEQIMSLIQEDMVQSKMEAEQEQEMGPDTLSPSDYLAMQAEYARLMQGITDQSTAYSNALADEMNQYAAGAGPAGPSLSLYANTLRTNSAMDALARQAQGLQMPYQQYLDWENENIAAAQQARVDMEREAMLQRLGLAPQSTGSSMSLGQLTQYMQQAG